mgnify:FL=1
MFRGPLFRGPLFRGPLLRGPLLRVGSRVSLVAVRSDCSRIALESSIGGLVPCLVPSGAPRVQVLLCEMPEMQEILSTLALL